jgi:hypothetical protein
MRPRKTLALGPDPTTGKPRLVSDQPGASVSATVNEDNTVTIREVLADGSMGDQLTVPVAKE